MARIPLRAYAREVENLIEHGQIEEAIAHAKNILKQFPKYIEAYRLLAKAYLESQRYTEALDILQRILSVFPDDFIAHLGMSIIREDEGNLDAAIWHMERAYEVQPFNRAVQDELRRLYGRRDGVEPPRIRLTRGALVRMYDRGNLYPQAIAEIRAALAEDGARLDLLVLLAKMYFLSGQKIEAAEVASSLISKLPYCYEANRILVEVLPETSRAGDAPLFKQRLLALDPYLGFISPNAPTSDQVPEQTVMVEHLDWAPSMVEEAAPEWAKTIGVEWETASQEEELPDWLNALAQPAETSAPPSPTPAVTPPSSPEEILPDFLKSAGWMPSEGENLEAEQGTLIGGFEEEETLETEAEPVEAEIPDWLKSLKPSVEEEISETPEPPPVEEERLDWLEEILPPPSPEVKPEGTEELLSTEWMFPQEPFPKPEGSEETGFDSEAIPDWMRSEATLPESTLSTGEEELPDWLKVMESTPTADVKEEEELPEWLKSSTPGEFPGSEAPGIPSATEEISPEWLETLAPVSEEPTPPLTEQQPEATLWLSESEEFPTPQPSEETEQEPEWLAAIEEAPSSVVEETPPHGESSPLAQQDISLSETPPEDLEAALAWMEALAARQGAPEETLTISSPEQRKEEIPDWLKEQIHEEPVAEEKVTLSTQEPETPTEQWTELIAGEAEVTIPEQTAEISSVGEATEQSPDLSDIDAALAWMEALAARQGAEPETLTITPPEQRQEIPPDWIKEELQEAESSAVSEIELPEEVQPSAITTEREEIPPAKGEKTLEEMSPDEAFAWLESLAARQGAQEGTLFTPEEERPEVPPIPESVIEETLEEAEETPPVSMKEEPEAEWIPEEALPEIPVAEMQLPVAEEQKEEVEIPEWLRSYEEEQKAQPPVWEPPSLEINPEEVPDEALPDWLRVTPEEHEPVPTIAREEPPALQPEETTPASEITPTAEVKYAGEGEPSPAWAAIQAGNISSAVDTYSLLIQEGKDLEKLIWEIEEALKVHPHEATLWQTLGDAYFRADQVARALEAYTKAEEYLH